MDPKEAPSTLDRLSERQRECLGMMARGFSPKEVAAELGLSVETVHAHLKAARRTLGVTSSREAARLLAGSQSVGTHALVMGGEEEPTLTRRQDEGSGTAAGDGDELRDPWSGAAPARNLWLERPRGRLDELTITQRAALLVLALVAMTIVLAGLVATAGGLQRLLWQIYYGR